MVSAQPGLDPQCSQERETFGQVECLSNHALFANLAVAAFSVMIIVFGG